MNPQPKHKRWKSNKYLDYIRHQPCIITMQQAEPHHLKIKGNSGTSRKPSDYYCLPVTRDIHQEWEAHTNEYIEEKYCIDVYQELFKMVTGYLKEDS